MLWWVCLLLLFVWWWVGLDHSLQWKCVCSVKVVFALRAATALPAAAAHAPAEGEGAEGKHNAGADELAAGALGGDGLSSALYITPHTFALALRRLLALQRAEAQGSGASALRARSADRTIELVVEARRGQRKAVEAAAASDMCELIQTLCAALFDAAAAPAAAAHPFGGGAGAGAGAGAGLHAAGAVGVSGGGGGEDDASFDASANHRGRLEALVVKHPAALSELTFHPPKSAGPAHALHWFARAHPHPHPHPHPHSPHASRSLPICLPTPCFSLCLCVLPLAYLTLALAVGCVAVRARARVV